ncbi:MAG: hypothetical protein IPP57_19135 [Candidatus Obscuribacter sp.]|nr:hypothetical protein [Candidatus Obscuribacter sp.]
MTAETLKNLMDKFPLLIIESDAEAKKANAVMDELMQLSKPSAPVVRYGRTLAMLIEQYERKQYPALFERIATAAELVKGLTELHDLSQNDLCKIAGINKQNFSAYVAGHRGLPRLARERLAKHFGLSVLDFEFYAEGSKALKIGQYPVSPMNEQLFVTETAESRSTAKVRARASKPPNAKTGKSAKDK